MNCMTVTCAPCIRGRVWGRLLRLTPPDLVGNAFVDDSLTVRFLNTYIPSSVSTTPSAHLQSHLQPSTITLHRIPFGSSPTQISLHLTTILWLPHFSFIVATDRPRGR